MSALDTIRNFQKGNKFRNATEIRNPKSLSVQGTIPHWLDGVLYRVGPGKYNLGEDGKQHAIQHAFDGLSFVHRFEISATQQSVKYNSRLTAEGLEKSILSNPAQETYFGHLPEAGGAFSDVANMVRRAASTGVGKDPSASNVGVTITPEYPLPGALPNDHTDPLVLIAKTDVNQLQQVHSVTLEPKHLFTYAAYDNRLDGQLSAAHHKHDSATGEAFNFTLSMGLSVSIKVFSLRKNANGSEQTTVLGEITHRKLPGVPVNRQDRIQPPYIHAFWLTEHYVIIPESNLHYVHSGADIVKNGALVPSMAWREDGPGYLHVVRRDGGGHVVTMPVDPFFLFHTSNAWDTKLSDGTSVLQLDACVWPDGDFIHQVSRFGIMRRSPPAPTSSNSTSAKLNGLTFPPAPDGQFGDLRRYTLEFNENSISNAKATHRLIAPNVEFPRYNPLDNLKPYTYIWGCRQEHATATDVERFGLIKINTDTGKTLTLNREKYMFTEPVFVSRPDAIERDDGVLLSFANVTDPHCPEHDRCVLSIIDAKDMVELARCDVGQFSCLTFHGSFISDAHFESSNFN